jgi:hypothetical protein
MGLGRTIRLLGAGGLCFAALTGLGAEDKATGAAGLEWRTAGSSVDADIEDWPLIRLLEQISAKTRWQILVEPESDCRVTAKFKGLKTGQALSRLLGQLNFLLVPATNGPPRLLIFRTSAAAATDLVAAPAERDAPTAGAKALPRELVVVLKPGAKETIEEIAKRLGAKIKGRADELRAYRLEFEDDSAAAAARTALADNPDIEGIDANFEVPRPDRPEAMALGVLPPFTLRPKAITDASRVVVGLIDTAVQLEGTVLKEFLLPQVSVVGKASAPLDVPSHGTVMGETILYRLAQSPESKDGTPVRLLPVDVYGDGGATTTFEIAKGVYAAINGGATIVNMSFGGDGNSQLLREVIKAGHEQGVVFLGAAGNEPVTTPTYPAAYPEVIAVTASTRGGQVASYANRGEFVDVAAPGASVVPFQDRPYLVVGTSAATANVSAAAALLKAVTGKAGSDLEAQVREVFPIRPTPGTP